MMYKILCTEAGNKTYRDWVKGWGFNGIRCDIPIYAPTEWIAQLIGDLAESQMHGIFIVGGWSRWQPRGAMDGKHIHDDRYARNINDVAVQAGIVTKLSRELGCTSHIEGGNEPDITDGLTPGKFVEMCARMHEAISTENPLQSFITGGVSNIRARDGLSYLREALDQGLVTGKQHGNVSVGVHPYRTEQEPWEPVDGADVRSVIRSIKREAGPVACTEIGWHTAPQERKKGLFGLCREKFQFDDDDVREFAAYELELWDWAESPVFGWYGANSGPSDRAIDNFGIRPYNYQLGRVDDTRVTAVVDAFRNFKNV